MLNSRIYLPAAAVVVLAAFGSTSAGERFFHSLRIARPEPVSANPALPGGGTSARPLQDAIAGMLTANPKVSVDESTQPAAGEAAAATTAGFTPRLVRARRDSATLYILGARDATLAIDPAQLRTILDEAGDRSLALPASLQGATLRLRSPRAVRAQWGNCPAPANTIASQIQGPPSPSAENASCLILVESPAVTASAPPGLDVALLTEIALELAGMSPNQARDYQQVVDWPYALALSLPRGVRAYEPVSVHGDRGMLVNTGARRGPTWALVWRSGAIVYELSGYGNPADALALATSVS